MKKIFFLTLLFSFLFSCKESKQDTNENYSSFVPNSYTLLFSTTPNDYFSLLFKENSNGDNQASDLPDFKNLLTFLKLDEKIYAFKTGKDLSGISFTINDSTTYRSFLMENFSCEFSGNNEVEFAQTQFRDFTFYSVWNNKRGVIIQSYADLDIDNIYSLVKTENCISSDSLVNYDSKELIAYHLTIPDSLFNRRDLSIHGTIALEDSSAIIKSNIVQNGKPFAVFAKPQTIQVTQDLLTGYINLSEEAKTIITEQIDLYPKIKNLLANWAGELNFTYSGTDTLKTQIVSYEYDENFNEIETKKITKKPFYKIKGSLSMNSNENATSFLSQLEDDGFLIKGKKDYTTIFLTNKTKVFPSKNKIIISSLKQIAKGSKKTTSFFINIDNNKNNLIDHLKLPKVNINRFKPLTQDIEYIRAKNVSNNATVLKIKFNKGSVSALKTLTTKSYRF